MTPYTNGDYDAWLVRPGGDVYYSSNAGYSYGRESPSTGIVYGYAWHVYPSGDVNFDGGDYVGNSYGRPISPGTDCGDHACYVNPSGVVYSADNYGVYDSYGIW